MIAQRFRALGWVAGIASAACGLYLISLQVAAERAKLEQVDARIAKAQRDMQMLRTELATRASYRQLEKWNDDTLSLAAPRAAQFLHSETQLSALSPGMLDAAPDRLVPRAQLAAATETPPAPMLDAPVATERAAYVPAVAPKPAKLQRVAMVERPMLDRDTLGDLVRAAAKEGRARK